jgi:hypothetical protein
MDTGSVHQLEKLRSGVHRVPVTSCFPSVMGWFDFPVADLLASSITKENAGENVAKHIPYDAVCRSNPLF